jgi:hypothetical protein
MGGKNVKYKSNKSSLEITQVRKASHCFRKIFHEKGFALSPEP